MASFLSKILSPKSNKSIQAPAIPVHRIEDAVEKPERSLLHLVRLNHVNNSVWAHKSLSDSMTACNIVPQHLISAFLLGADNTLLGEIFDLDSKVLEQWQSSPGEVVGEDWMDFLGKREYGRAFLDFFEDTLVEEGYDWKAVLHKFLFTGEQPLISSITAGLGQPLIHLGLALQMTSRDLALEALTLVATSYYDNDIYKYSDDASYFSTESLFKSSSLSSIINRVREDTRFNNETIALPGEHNMTIIFRDHEAALLDHCNAWTMSSNLTSQLQEMQKFSVAILLGAKNPEDQQYDKCLLFPLLMSHAIHVILPHIPGNVQITLVQQWWLTTLAIFVAQLRPEIDFEIIARYESENETKNWKWIAQQATKSSHASDAYFVHMLRVLRDLGHAWPDSEDYFLKAGVKFTKEFGGWNEISL